MKVDALFDLIGSSGQGPCLVRNAYPAAERTWALVETFKSGHQIKKNCSKSFASRSIEISLNLGFLEFYVLAHDGIVFLENYLFCRRARILLCHIEVASACRRKQLDLLSYRLGH